MDTIRLVADVALLTTLVIVGYFLKNYLPSYFGEKGKNLATKEDISEITKKIESVRVAYAAELENRKAEMARLSHEHQVRYTRLYEERAKVIAQLYGRLAEFHDAVRALAILASAQSDGGVAAALPLAQESASKRYKSLSTLFRRTRIWL